jgi:hypothetical protein
MESCFGTLKSGLVHQACYKLGMLPDMTCSPPSKDITIISGFILPSGISRFIRCPPNRRKVVIIASYFGGAPFVWGIADAKMAQPRDFRSFDTGRGASGHGAGRICPTSTP